MADAEMLLFVHNNQPEVLELDRLAQERMGADDDVDLALGETFFDLGELWAETSREACATCTG